jgi:hypothetical protein
MSRVSDIHPAPHEGSGLHRVTYAAATDRVDELAPRRVDVRRIGVLLEAAAATLRCFGHQREAERLKAELGIPVEVLRSKYRPRVRPHL